MYTLYDKIFNSHVVLKIDDKTSLLAVDKHLIHEVTSPQAFDDMHSADRMPFDSKSLLLTEDHNIPTIGGYETIKDSASKMQVDELRSNAKKHNLLFFPMGNINQGIVHVVAPEQGFILPGMTVICGDSHTATHGALGVLAFGVGSSEVSHALQTGALQQQKLKNMNIIVNGKLSDYVTSKDVILYIIGQIGTSAGTGYAIEFSGEVFENMSIEARMTVCNMAIEAGAKVGLVKVDKKTIDYIRATPMAPTGKNWHAFTDFANTLHSDPGAKFDKEFCFVGEDIHPQVTWGTSPEEVTSIFSKISLEGRNANHVTGALKYMSLEIGQRITHIPITHVFIGSCTNSRIEDMREVARVILSTKKKVKHDIIKQAIIVPGSGLVKKQAENEGLDKIFIDAGFEWRNPGCSSCLAMNDDKMPAGSHVASTSNRNFEDRQGSGARTHLCSPIIATLAALYGHFVEPTDETYYFGEKTKNETI